MIISAFHGFGPGRKKSGQQQGHYTLVRTQKRLRRLDVIQFVSLHAAILFQALFLCVGLILGAVFSRNADQSFLQRLDLLFFSDLSTRASGSAVLIFASSAASSFLFIFACFLLGLSLWGAFFLPVIPFLRGFGFGLISGYLYLSYGLKGIGFQCLVILPGAYLCILGILHAAKEATHFSRSLANSFSSKINDPVKTTNHNPSFKYYFTRFAFFLLIVFAAAVVDVLTSVCFAGMFSFQ